MSKRRVPAALHAELTEYAALMRALRTRDIMDLTKQIKKASPFTLKSEDDVEMGAVSDSDFSTFNTGASSSKSDKAKGKQRTSSSSGKKAQIRRDHWTRWPLLLNDVPKPEWALEDEVAVVATMATKMHRSAQHLMMVTPSASEKFEGDDELIFVDMEVDEDDPDHAFYIPDLTTGIAEYLSTILADFASYTPARAASMQNRIEPLGWRAVVDAAVSCGNPEFANPTVIDNVIRRMEAIYGPSISPLDGKMATSYRPVERIHAQKAARERTSQILAREDAALFERPAPRIVRVPSPPKSPKRKRSAKIRKEEADFVGRKKWVPKDKDKTLETAAATEPQVNADTQGAEAVHPRRSGRAAARRDYRELAHEDTSAIDHNIRSR